MDVHNRLGPGLREVHYQRALLERLGELGVPAVREHPLEVYFDDRPVGRLYIDCLVQGEVIVELKAFPHLLTGEEIAQVITYLAASGKPVGLLFNFGRRRLEFRRIFPPKKLNLWRDRIERYLWRPAETRNWRDNNSG